VVGDCGDGGVVGQEDQCVVEPDLSAPLRVSEAEVVAEAAGEGAGAGPDLTSEVVEGTIVGGVCPQDVVQFAEQWVGGGRQVEGPFGGDRELVEHDGAQAVVGWAVVVGVAGVGDDELAQEGADGEDGGFVQAEGVLGGGQADEVEVELAVGLVLVDGARGDPESPSGGATQEPASVVTAMVPRLA
jgi:hypothetical protein